MAMKRKRTVWSFVLVVIVVGVYLWREYNEAPADLGDGPPIVLERPGTDGATGVDDTATLDDAAIVEAFERQRSGVVVECSGVVDRVLSDDLEGSPHQRIVLELASGHTVLISHNIDLAPRVAGIEVGDRLDFRGQYEWNDRGGVVHWTHHDPAGRRPGGWLRHEGREYR